MVRGIIFLTFALSVSSFGMAQESLTQEEKAMYEQELITPGGVLLMDYLNDKLSLEQTAQKVLTVTRQQAEEEKEKEQIWPRTLAQMVSAVEALKVLSRYDTQSKEKVARLEAFLAEKISTCQTGANQDCQISEPNKLEEFVERLQENDSPRESTYEDHRP